MAFEVEIKDLRDSAKAAREAAGEVAKVRPGAALTGVKGGIPGAACLGQVDEVATSWGTELKDWVTAARGYAQTLEDNAQQYASDDAAAKAAFTPKDGPGAPDTAAPSPAPRRPPGVRPKYGKALG